MHNLFDRLYKYKQSLKRHNKENFLTEIFAYCLENDEIFRNKFLTLINYQKEYFDFKVKTQFVDYDLGRPDLHITIDSDTILLIECKVDSKQQITQLSRYNEILRKSNSTKNYLIFLTKFYENFTHQNDTTIIFKDIRWYQIFELLRHSENLISKELSNYLSAQKMDSSISFTENDKLAVSFISENIQNMNALITRFSDILKRYNNSDKVKFDKLNDLIYNGHYGVSAGFKHGTAWLGFFQNENNDEMQICISLIIPKKTKQSNQLVNFLELNQWVCYGIEDDVSKECYKCSGISFFIEENIFQIKKACDFVETGFEIIKKYL